MLASFRASEVERSYHSFGWNGQGGCEVAVNLSEDGTNVLWGMVRSGVASGGGSGGYCACQEVQLGSAYRYSPALGMFPYAAAGPERARAAWRSEYSRHRTISKVMMPVLLLVAFVLLLQFLAGAATGRGRWPWFVAPGVLILLCLLCLTYVIVYTATCEDCRSYQTSPEDVRILAVYFTGIMLFTGLMLNALGYAIGRAFPRTNRGV